MQIFMTTLTLFPWLLQVLADSCPSPGSQLNMKLVGHVLATYSAVQASNQCEEKCALHAICHSVNYYSNQGTCEVNKANHLTNPESLIHSAGCLYLNYYERAVSRCSNKLCSYPLQCNVERDGHGYKCSSCRDQDKVLQFPSEPNNGIALYENPFVSLTAFTISMWVQFVGEGKSQVPFSYATVDEDNEITIRLKDSRTGLHTFGEFRTLYYDLDNQWHHICITWASVNGNYAMYFDGVLGSQGIVKKGHVIEKGALILGQEQDSYKGGFEIKESFRGNLTGVTMWDKVLTGDEVSTLASKCSVTEGNVIRWMDFHDGISGSATLICSRFCDN